MVMDKGDVMEWAAEVRMHLHAGETVEFSPKGLSMWPSLRPDSDTVFVRAQPRYARLDMVLAVSEHPKGVFLHRVIHVEPDRYILMGDANLYQTEECRPENVLGKVTCIRRDGKNVTASLSMRLLRAMHRLHPAVRRLAVRIINKMRVITHK